jgi:ssDNA-binding replication factor A large subunit
VNLVKPGDLIKIENAFAKEFRGKIELSIGRNGRITVVKREEIENEELEEVPEEDEISDIE